MILKFLLLFFNCKSNSRRYLPTFRRLREDFQKTSLEVFSKKTSLEVFYKKLNFWPTSVKFKSNMFIREVFSGNFEIFCLQRKVRRLLGKSSIKNTQKVNCKINLCIDIVEQIWKIKCSSRFHTLNLWDDLRGFSNRPELHHNSYLLVNHKESWAYEAYIICNQNLQFFLCILRESVRYVVCVDRKWERMRKIETLRH